MSHQYIFASIFPHFPPSPSLPPPSLPPHQATFTNDIQDTLSKALEGTPSVETLYYAVISMANTDMKSKHSWCPFC